MNKIQLQLEPFYKHLSRAILQYSETSEMRTPWNQSKMFSLGDVHILEVFSHCKRYKWDWEIVLTKGVHISLVPRNALTF